MQKIKPKSYLSLTEPCNPKETGHPFFIYAINLTMKPLHCAGSWKGWMTKA